MTSRRWLPASWSRPQTRNCRARLPRPFRSPASRCHRPARGRCSAHTRPTFCARPASAPRKSPRSPPWAPCAVAEQVSRTTPMSWQSELDELRAHERLARDMGGVDKVRRQHEGGRLTVRERIDRLIDPGSLHEIGAIAGKAEYDAAGCLSKLTPANCVMGRAKIDGRPVVVVGDDFTVRGGSADATIPMKPILAERMANELRLPIVRIIEGSGGGGSVKTIETTGRSNLPGQLGQSSIGFQLMTDALSAVPVVALGLGSVAGLGAARLAASHYSVMTKGTSAMFVAGPPVVARAGQQLDKQALGGWEVQWRAGAVDHAVATEEEACQCARRFLSYLPSSAHDVAA